ncbi:hypothetical protein [Streptomyces sp. NPDC059009]|uniref:hypothetical protein n=1 Tax=Streptomyces sp. NPDC059009 TaxID=3346694 RepID=UPI00369AA24D
MRFLRSRSGVAASALTVGVALLAPLTVSSPADAAVKGFHSKKGIKSCPKKGQTVWMYAKGAGKFRASWRAAGTKKIRSRQYMNTPDGISTTVLPTWRKNAAWKLTSTYGNGKNLAKAFAFCSTRGTKTVGKGKVNDKKVATKRCGKGKQVFINSQAIGRVEHKFKTPGRGHHVYTQDFNAYQGYLLAWRGTPTGKRAVTYSIRAKDVPGKLRGAVIKKTLVQCLKY